MDWIFDCNLVMISWLIQSLETKLDNKESRVNWTLNVLVIGFDVWVSVFDIHWIMFQWWFHCNSFDFDWVNSQTNSWWIEIAFDGIMFIAVRGECNFVWSRMLWRMKIFRNESMMFWSIGNLQHGEFTYQVPAVNVN